MCGYTTTHDQVMFNASNRNVMTFEEFLDKAAKAGSGDPGSSMLCVLRNNPVPGVDLSRIENNLHLNPSGNPGNVLRFLSHIAAEGRWGVNLHVTVR